MLALLEVFRIYLQHALPSSAVITAAPPSYAEFRETIELLDRRSKCFKDQSLDLIKELRLSSAAKAGKGVGGFGLFIFGGLAVIIGFVAGRIL